jgi:hypothetical protein
MVRILDTMAVAQHSLRQFRRVGGRDMGATLVVVIDCDLTFVDSKGYRLVCATRWSDIAPRAVSMHEVQK